jgi:hypothetical protein
MGSKCYTFSKIGLCRKIAWIDKKGLYKSKEALDIKNPSNGRYHFSGLNALPPDALSHFNFSVLLLLSHPVGLGNLGIPRQQSKRFRTSTLQCDAFQTAPPV